MKCFLWCHSCLLSFLAIKDTEEAWLDASASAAAAVADACDGGASPAVLVGMSACAGCAEGVEGCGAAGNAGVFCRCRM